MRILVIDNNIDPDSWGAPEIVQYAKRASGSTVEVRRAPQGDLPESPKRYDRIIVSGSKTSPLDQDPWITKLEIFMRTAISEGTPLLGICFGHQMLGRTLGGITAVRRAQRGEWGWGEIEFHEDFPLTRGLSKKFHSFQWHFDEVCELGPGLKNFATSSNCSIQAVQLEKRAVFGIQFHPERGLEKGKRSIASRKGVTDIAILNPDLGDQLYQAEVAEKIFENFLTLKGSTK